MGKMNTFKSNTGTSDSSSGKKTKLNPVSYHTYAKITQTIYILEESLDYNVQCFDSKVIEGTS